MIVENIINITCSILALLVSVCAFKYTLKNDKKEKELEKKQNKTRTTYKIRERKFGVAIYSKI